MLYWGLDDYLAAAIIIISALSVYVSVDITRISSGAPRAWQLIILAFTAMLVYRAVQLYYDTQSESNLIDDWEALLSLIAGLLLLGGLAMLDLSFRKHSKAAGQTA